MMSLKLQKVYFLSKFWESQSQIKLIKMNCSEAIYNNEGRLNKSNIELSKYFLSLKSANSAHTCLKKAGECLLLVL